MLHNHDPCDVSLGDFPIGSSELDLILFAKLAILSQKLENDDAAASELE
jgi:hypothetical protein